YALFSPLAADGWEFEATVTSSPTSALLKIFRRFTAGARSTSNGELARPRSASRQTKIFFLKSRPGRSVIALSYVLGSSFVPRIESRWSLPAHSAPAQSSAAQVI